MTKKIVTLAGDGIGPEIMAAGLEVLSAVAKKIDFHYSIKLGYSNKYYIFFVRLCQENIGLLSLWKFFPYSPNQRDGICPMLPKWILGCMDQNYSRFRRL